VRRDVDLLYEGLFLRTVVEFEDFLETRFFEIVSGRIGGGRARMGARISTTSALALREIVLGGDDYVKWLPYSETEDRANRFLKGGRPFSLLGDDDKSKIAQITFIRHAIAHSSEFARGQFLRKVVGSTNLLPKEKSPAGFLRSVARAPNITRYQVYSSALGSISMKLDRKH